MSVNNVFLLGRLGAPPERRVTSSGKPLCTFRLATRRWDATAGADAADWHSVVAWERTAELCQQYLEKGSQVAVEGRLTTRSWEGPDGKPCYKTEVIAHRVTFLQKSGRSTDPGPRAPESQAAIADDIPF